MSDKFTARQRRSRKLRSKTKEMSNHRLSIFRSNNQIYAHKKLQKKLENWLLKELSRKALKRLRLIDRDINIMAV